MVKKILVSVIVVCIIAAGFLWFFFIHSAVRAVETSSEAIDRVVDEYPKLSGFALSSIAPRYVETKQVEDGWYIGFIEKGTDIPGVSSASCYFVSKGSLVSERGTYERKVFQDAVTIDLENCTPMKEEGAEPVEPVHEIVPYGTTTVTVNETVFFSDFSFRVLSIESDSRCAEDVTCIQAGTLIVKIEVISKRGTNTSIIKLGEQLTTDAADTEFLGATPYPHTTVPIQTSEYKLIFHIKNVELEPSVPVPLPPGVPVGKCYAGGCSGQVCSDDPGSVSTCEFRPEYACYRTATCERQSNGACGWTKTPELTQCLAGQGQ